MRYIKFAVGYGVLVVKTDMPVQARRRNNSVIKPVAEVVASSLELYCGVGGFFVRPYVNIERGKVAALKVDYVYTAYNGVKRGRVFRRRLVVCRRQNSINPLRKSLYKCCCIRFYRA